MTQDAAAIYRFQCYRPVAGTVGRIQSLIGPLPVGWMRFGNRMAAGGRTGAARIVEKIRIVDRNYQVGLPKVFTAKRRLLVYCQTGRSEDCCHATQTL